MDAALAILFLAVFEGVQLAILSWQALQIRRKMAAILPEGLTAGQAIAEAVFVFMEEIQKDPKKAEVVGGFIRGSAEAAWDQVSKKVPMLQGAGAASVQLDRIASKNPWMGFGLGLAQGFAPMAQEALANRSQAQKGGGKSSGGVNF